MAQGWWHQAVCRGMNPRLFDLNYGDDISAEVVKACRRCEVQVECLVSALEEEAGKDSEHRGGIRGGYTPGGRSRLSRGLRAHPVFSPQFSVEKRNKAKERYWERKARREAAAGETVA